jgi:hypothetical protein
MTLNRASRKEADTRLSLLRKQVSLQVFTLAFEDSACRETRTAAEELAETTSRLSVEINIAGETGDLMRKFRVDGVPALVASAKEAPDLRVYGTPTGYALPALLDAMVAVGTPADPKSELKASIESAAAGGPRASVRLDLIVSRRDPSCAEAAAALWRVAVADRAAGDPLRIVPSLRIVEDFPFWAASVPAGSPLGGAPFLLIDGADPLPWPFTDAGIAERLLR